MNVTYQQYRDTLRECHREDPFVFEFRRLPDVTVVRQKFSDRCPLQAVYLKLGRNLDDYKHYVNSKVCGVTRIVIDLGLPALAAKQIMATADGSSNSYTHDNVFLIPKTALLLRDLGVEALEEV